MKIMENKFSLDKSKKVFPIILMVVGLGIMVAQLATRQNLVGLVSLLYCCIMSAIILLSLIIKKKVYLPMVLGDAYTVTDNYPILKVFPVKTPSTDDPETPDEPDEPTGCDHEYDDEYDEDDEYQYYLIFKSNGTMKIIEIEEGEEWEESGTYTLSGERLKVKFYGETEYVDIASLTSDELVLDWSDEDGKFLEYYERVD